MKKKLILLAVVFVSIAVICILLIPENKSNRLEGISNYTPNSIAGVGLSVNANAKECGFTIENTGKKYITIDFRRYPLRLEIYNDDRWYRFVQTKFVYVMPEAISSGDSTAGTLRWNSYYDANLKAGRYRIILFYGTGDSETYEYNAVTEFEIR